MKKPTPKILSYNPLVCI